MVGVSCLTICVFASNRVAVSEYSVVRVQMWSRKGGRESDRGEGEAEEEERNGAVIQQQQQHRRATSLSEDSR